MKLTIQCNQAEHQLSRCYHTYIESHSTLQLQHDLAASEKLENRHSTRSIHLMLLTLAQSTSNPRTITRCRLGNARPRNSPNKDTKAKRRGGEASKNSRVSDGIQLQEVVLAAVAGNLQLGAEPDHRAGSLGFGDRPLDVLHVAVEVHGPLVQVTRRHLQQPHRRTPLPASLPGHGGNEDGGEELRRPTAEQRRSRAGILPAEVRDSPPRFLE